MKKAVIAVALSVLAALLSANVNTVAHAQGNLVAPSNVTAQHTGNPGEVRISWGAVPNAAYYRIGWVAYSDVEPIIASGGDWLEHFAFIDIENRGQTEHFITRLTPGVQYAFIMASNDGRYGTPRWPSSAGWAFLRLNEAPATHASLGSTAINLTWDPVPGAAYYRIGWVVYEDVAPIIAAGGDWLEHFAFIDIQNRGQTARAIGRLTPGLQYAFIVAGNDGRYGTPQWPPASAWQFMTPSVVQPTGPDSDRAALIALYDATDGPNWPNRTNWLSDEPLEHWYGVTTDDDGRVTQLLLRENNLNGPIPAAVGNLTGLVRLDFQGNQLSGSIPGSLGNLANLERLSLSRNSLSGPIPPGLLNLTELKELYLHTNQLSGTIPSSLSNLAGLEILLLYGNRFTGTIPSSLGNLSDLVELNLSSNDLTGVIPPELGRLTKLTYLSLRSNGLTGPIPSELGDMSSLRSLYLYDNQLDGPIPPNLKNLSNLEGLLLHDNQLSRPVPAWLGNLSRLRSLNLSINGFTGGIPPELGRLSNLSYLNLRSNDLTGPVPTELGNLSNLEQLYLYENQLSGEIPDSLGRLSNLTRINLRDNQLTGEIPAELGNLTKLELIRLAGNQLTGCVPTGLRNVAINDFSSLALSFCGETPTAATDRAALVALYDTTGGTNWTDNTNWRGNSSIGEWYGVTTNDDGRVTELRLHQNNLSGQIPAALGNLSNLEVLLLLDNGLTGPIPPALGSLSNVRIFYLYQNQLMGDMPSSLGNLSNLERFSVRDNLLSGEIPSWLGNLTKLDWLRLDGNDFTGPIPPALGRLSNLTRLILGGNRLTGSVPSWLGGMGSLELLALNDNQLTGEIPAELGNLVNLQLIWLGGNALTGCVPAALQNVADNDLDLLELPNCSEETIVTGFGMDIFDKAIPGLMTKWNIPGGAVALSRNGKLLLAKGYGYADIENREQVQPDSLFRIASLSKPITAVAVLKLVEDGHLNLDDRVFDILDQFEPPGGTIADPRIREVTVRQLLQHSGGWDRERSFDPMFRLGQIERELGVAKPVSCADVIRFMLIRPLDFDPGTDYRYSNFGYCILGRVIEAKTGHSYEAYVKNAVLNPVGITGMRIGGALLNERSEGEVRYYGYTGQSLADSVIPGTPQRVPWEYGGFSLQTMDSNGGWLASTMDLLRFVTALDESREPLILRSETVDTMTARPDIDRWRDSPWHYAMGWLVRPVNDDANWWHTGSLPGTRTLLVRIYPGMAWAVLFNSSPHDSEQMARELNELMWKVTSETSQWPSHDLFPRYGYE